MTLQILYPEGKSIPTIPRNLITNFSNIICDSDIHSGWPHIKGTRILATDIFRSQVQGYSLNNMIMEFKEMGVLVSKEQLEEAFLFTLEWLRYSLNEEKNSKTSK